MPGVYVGESVLQLGKKALSKLKENLQGSLKGSRIGLGARACGLWVWEFGGCALGVLAFFWLDLRTLTF